MNLSGGQNIVQPSGGRSGGGGIMGRLANIVLQNQSYAQMLQGRKELVTHTTDERVREQELKGAVGRKHLLDTFDATQERYTANHPDVLSGKIKPDKHGDFPEIRPDLAEHARLAGLTFDSKGQPQTGPVAGIKRTTLVSGRRVRTQTPPTTKVTGNPMPTTPPKFSKSNPKFGSYADFGDVNEAVKSGKISQEEGANLSLPGKAYQAPVFKNGPLESDQEIEKIHRNAGLNTNLSSRKRNGTPSNSSLINEFPHGTI